GKGPDRMTINSATAGAGWFLNGISNLQQELPETGRQLSSGYRVQDAADAPGQAADLVGLESSLAADQAWQSNLSRVQAEANSADTALGSAISLLDNARSLAAEAGGSVLAPASIPNILAQVKQIQQQIVGLANTTVEGRYIFGGDSDQSSPYQYDATTGSVTALSALATALTNNDQPGIAAALASLGSASTYLNQQQAYYGAAEQRLTSEQNSAANRITAFETN